MKKLILILGGSTFMGKELLSDLSKNESYEVHYINRGKTYWNNAVTKIENVHYTFGNREDTNDFTILLKYLSKKLGVGVNNRKWEAVIDFSAFYSNQVKSVYSALRGLCNLYVFISTDSIYDVCKIGSTPINENQD
jgi:UDP-glucose 4-epimerase